MVRDIVKDTAILSQRSEKATEDDAQVVTDLLDTLAENSDMAVCLAANQIGELKRVIALVGGEGPYAMVNPIIVDRKQPYFADEECLSVEGSRKVRRYKRIKVRYLDADFKPQSTTLTDFAAEAVQHAVDHCNGILV